MRKMRELRATRRSFVGGLRWKREPNTVYITGKMATRMMKLVMELNGMRKLAWEGKDINHL